MKKILSIFAAMALVALTGCSQIDTGNVGVESTLGQVKKETMSPGGYFTLFKHVTEVSGKELPLVFDNMKPQTKDKIYLDDLDIDVYVQIDTTHAVDILTRWPNDITRERGEDGDRIGMNFVGKQARSVIYDVVTEFESATVHTARKDIEAQVVKQLQADLDSSAGKGWFIVHSANVRNLKTDPALEASIKESANRQFQINSKQKEVELAEAEARRKRAEAQGEADAIRIKASAISSQGGEDYVRLQAIAKWDGKLPTTQAGGAVPFVNLK